MTNDLLQRLKYLNDFGRTYGFDALTSEEIERVANALPAIVAKLEEAEKLREAGKKLNAFHQAGCPYRYVGDESKCGCGIFALKVALAAYDAVKLEETK